MINQQVNVHFGFSQVRTCACFWISYIHVFKLKATAAPPPMNDHEPEMFMLPLAIGYQLTDPLSFCTSPRVQHLNWAILRRPDVFH